MNVIPTKSHPPNFLGWVGMLAYAGDDAIEDCDVCCGVERVLKLKTTSEGERESVDESEGEVGEGEGRAIVSGPRQ